MTESSPSPRAGSIGLTRRRAARLQADHGETEIGGHRAVLAFGVDDGEVAAGAVDGLQAADERFDGG